MNRKTLINIHLYLASFFAPVLVIIALSGGLYLLDVKGKNEETLVYTGKASEIDMKAESRDEETRRVLEAAGIEHSFDYALGNNEVSITRPTSRSHYRLEVKGEALTITRQDPDFVRTIVELHKGHGPSLFRTFQKIVAAALLLILLSGLYLGLTSPMLKTKTLAVSGSGLLITFLLIIF